MAFTKKALDEIMVSEGLIVAKGANRNRTYRLLAR